MAIAILFSMIFLISGDPASVALGPKATPEIIAALRQRMGLDQPVWRQFANFVGSVLRGDLGTEVLSGRPVLRVVMEQLPFTLALVVCGIIWSLALGIPLGCIAAVKRGGFVDRGIGLLSVAFIAVPSFVIAIYALLLFAVHLQWLPAIGAGEAGDPASRLRHLILPSLPVGLGWVGYIARMIRASMLETLEAGLSFLGLGVRPPTPSWGTILNDGFANIRDSSWIVISGGLPIVLTTLGFTFLGESMRDVLDPRLKGR